MQHALNGTQISSPLSGQAVIKPKGHTARRVLVSSLMLTSLVDAFSILVIFLLMSTQSGIEADLKKTEKLPMASKIETISKGIILRIEANGAYFVDDLQVTENNLAKSLAAAKAKHAAELPKGQAPNLVVQAEKQMDYEALSPVMRAGAAAGLHQFKFAVIEQANNR